MTPSGQPASVPPSRAERALAGALRLFARVEPGEVVVAAAMTLIVFLLMCGYYLLKTAREPLILLEGGAEVKLYAEAAQALLLVGVVRAYGEVARRVGRMKLLAIVYLFFTSNMVAFALLARTGLHIGLWFFLWVGIFSYTSVAQFWAFAADIYDEEQGKRLFPIVGVGSSLGAVVGARLARSLVTMGPQALMFGAAGLVVMCVVLLAWVERRAGIAGEARSAGGVGTAAPVAGETPLGLLVRDRYLLLIGALILLLNCVSGLGEYILDRTLLGRVGEARALGMSQAAFVGAFKAGYFEWYNFLGLLLQLFAVSRILRRFGVRNALLFLPATAVVGYGLFTFAPILGLIRVVKIAERAMDYSLTNTARHALFLVTSRVEKYVGKTMVDTVGARSGDFVTAGLVWLGTRARLPTAGFSWICLALAGVWVAVVFAIGRENLRRRTEGPLLVASEPGV